MRFSLFLQHGSAADCEDSSRWNLTESLFEIIGQGQKGKVVCSRKVTRD